jgi:hypothetical protein
MNDAGLRLDHTQSRTILFFKNDLLLPLVLCDVFVDTLRCSCAYPQVRCKGRTA